MTESKLHGMIPAIVTPLRKDGKIDREALGWIINNIMEHGGNGVMVLGSTGEGPLHKQETAIEMVRDSVELIKGRGVVVAGTTAVTFRQSMYLADAASEAGAEAVLNIPPFYFNLDDDEIIRYYTAYAERCRIPVMIYHMPSVSRRMIGIDALGHLSRHENIAGIKDSSGNFLFFQELTEMFGDRKDFSVFMGKALLIYSALTAGADGTMTPAGNLIPELEWEIYTLLLKGEWGQAKDVQKKICQIFKALNENGKGLGTNIKGVLNTWGVTQNYGLDYLEPLSSEEGKRLDEMIQFVLKEPLLQGE